jgi:glucose-1-phosphate thymidylyltransferase
MVTTERLVVLAGGMSSRMRNSSASGGNAAPELYRQAGERTKSMIGLGAEGRPFLDYLLFNAKAAGLRDLVIVIGERDYSTRSRYGEKERENEFHGLRISYAIQRIPEGKSKPPGTADALLTALRLRSDWKGTSFLSCNSDNLYSVQAFRLLASFEGPGAMIDYDREHLKFPEERIAQFGITRKNEKGYVVELVEKPGQDDLIALRGTDGTLRVSMNIFRLRYDIVVPFLERCPEDPVRKEKELPVALNLMVQSIPDALKAIPLGEHVPDLTFKEDIHAMQEFLTHSGIALDW